MTRHDDDQISFVDMPIENGEGIMTIENLDPSEMLMWHIMPSTATNTASETFSYRYKVSEFNATQDTGTSENKEGCHGCNGGHAILFMTPWLTLARWRRRTQQTAKTRSTSVRSGETT